MTMGLRRDALLLKNRVTEPERLHFRQWQAEVAQLIMPEFGPASSRGQ
ncbi:hypothetical protein [Limosilactobacillus fermentum]